MRSTIHPGDTAPLTLTGPLRAFQKLAAGRGEQGLFFSANLGSPVSGRTGEGEEGCGARHARRRTRSFWPSVSLRLARVPVAEATAYHVRLRNYSARGAGASAARRASGILDGNRLPRAGQSHLQGLDPAGAPGAPAPPPLLAFLLSGRKAPLAHPGPSSSWERGLTLWKAAQVRAHPEGVLTCRRG